MLEDVQRVLIDRETIAARVAALAEQIADDLAGAPAEAAASAVPKADAELPKDSGAAGPMHGARAGGSAEVTLVPILTGSMIFVADLMRRLPLRMQIHIVSVSSYPGAATESRGPSVEHALTRVPDLLAGRHVLIIDDILDSGRTLATVTQLLRQREPASLRTCVLLRKRRPSAMRQPVDYVAFDVPDEFVVGYGLDYNDYYRNLPEICTLKPGVFARA